MKLGIAITMYDEHDLVLESVQNIRKEFFDHAKIVVVQSDNGNFSPEIESIVNVYNVLDNLSNSLPPYKLPSYAISRNFSEAFSELYAMNIDYDLMIGFTGDTLIYDASNFIRRLDDMKKNDWKAMVSQAVGAKFNASDDDLAKGKSCGRLQTNLTTDFACCLFFIEGNFAKEVEAFAKIDITNEFTSEQCLGDELCRSLNVNTGKEFHERVGRLNANAPRMAYSYGDGVKYHAKTNGNPGR